MKLSEAIRLGAMLKPQGRSHYHFRYADGSESTCALGAALDALGILDTGDAITTEHAYFLLERHFSIQRLRIPCPVPDCDARGVQMLDLVVHLNDTHGWTREAIADWLDQHEKPVVEQHDVLHLQV